MVVAIIGVRTRYKARVGMGTQYRTRPNVVYVYGGVTRYKGCGGDVEWLWNWQWCGRGIVWGE